MTVMTDQQTMLLAVGNARQILEEYVGRRCHMFEEKREAVMAIEAGVLPLMPNLT